MRYYFDNALCHDILETVVTNGRLQLRTPEELEIEVEFEARERGLDEEQIKDAKAYAFEHFTFAPRV